MNSPANIPNLRFQLDNQQVTATPRPGERLSETLRSQFDARDVKIGCNAGDCGACTVLVDGAPVCACLTPTHQVDGKRVETLGGLYANDPLTQSLADRFLAHGAAQCGICTPGMMVAATALLRDTPTPTADQVEIALSGVLCRCTGYRKIIDAVVGLPPMAQTAPDATSETNTIGAPIPRLDGREKVAGTEAFGDDVAPAGTLEIILIRSPFARAGFTLGDLPAFQAATPGLVAILTAADVPGLNRHGVIPGFIDQPVFAEDETRFRGEAVAAVVLTPEAATTFAPDHFPITWQERPAASDIQTAQHPDTALLHDGHEANVMCGGLVSTGDADAALARADIVVEGTFQTGFVEHAYIEPEAGFARMHNGRIEVSACTQAPVMDLDTLEQVLGMDRTKIRVIPTGVGGGFGSKLDVSVQPYLAIAALKTGQPVRLCYSRTESMQSTTKRHPSDITLKIGATKDGRLSGFRFDGLFNTGAYASWGPTVANRVPVHASGPYCIADYHAQATGIYTNNPPSGAFRGFGVPQSAIAQESLLDVLADRLGMDPLDLRLLNALDNGTPTVCGQIFDQGVGIKPCLTALRPAWDSERAAANSFNADPANIAKGLKRGVGIASGWYGCGNTSISNPSTIKSGLRADGTVVLHQGATDIGQGSNTAITQIFAAALGVPTRKIHRLSGDTDVTPDAGKTSASRQTFISGNAAHLSGLALRAAIIERLNIAPDAALTFEPGQVSARDAAGTQVLDLSTLPEDAEGYVLSASETYDPPTKPLDANGQGIPYAQFGYAAQLCTVQVDTRLGTVTPLKFVAAHDVGQAINPILVQGQIDGGIAQGLGLALMEEYIPGRTENLHDYLIPTIGDVPPIETLIVEVPDAHGPHGAKGLGEHVLIPSAPAILNAIARAAGIRITQVPATPSRVQAEIKKANL